MHSETFGFLKSVLLLAATGIISVGGVTTFEKLTDLDYRGNTYYSLRNLTLHDCQGWCRKESECAAAAFSFVVNPLAPFQETLCLLQNETTAHTPTAAPQKAASMYYMVKIHIRSESMCSRPWSFERVPNKMLKNLDHSLLFTSTKEHCLAMCLNEHRFICRSAEYNHMTLECHLSKEDRRTAPDTDFINAPGIDYFENFCLRPNSTCKSEKQFMKPEVGVPFERVSHYVGLHYYVDKELQVSSLGACKHACEVEEDFLCRSFLYKASVTAGYNCQLFHMDHKTLPDGPATYLNTERPLIDNGNPLGIYEENVCKGKNLKDAPPPSPIILGPPKDDDKNGMDENGKPDEDCDTTGTCYDVQVKCKDTRIAVQVRTNKPFSGRIYAMGRSETCNVDVIDSDVFRLDLSLSGQDCNTKSVGGVYENTIVLQHHSVVMTKADKIYKVKCTYDISSRNITFGMMPIRDLDTISITSAPEAPPPKIKILNAFGKEVETVRIGDRLTFQIEIPNNTPYGIFARSCIAMAKDSRSTFSIIDDDGCPVEPSIFPKFTQSSQSVLLSEYEAFRFTESYGVIFQCNVKYCLGPCPPADCFHGREKFNSYGRRKRRSNHLEVTAPSVNDSSPDLTLSQEILVLDFNEELPLDLLPPRYNLPNSVPRYDVKPIEAVEENYRRLPPKHPQSNQIPDENGSCPTKNSVLVLSVVCGLLVLLYIASMICFLANSRPWRRSSPMMRSGPPHKHMIQ